LLFLQAHYRNALNFTWDALKGSEVALKRLREIYCELGNESNTRDMEIGGFMKQFTEAIADDVNTAKAVSILWQMIKSDLTNPQKKALIDRWNTVLGLDLAPRGETDIPQEVVSLAEKRKDAKAKKDFSLADDLRRQIEDKGYIVKDQKNDDYVIHRH
jgi:cysteinyl-tRNA synthetase